MPRDFRPYKTWPCGCYAPRRGEIKICPPCSVGGSKAVRRAYGRMRAMAKKAKQAQEAKP